MVCVEFFNIFPEWSRKFKNGVGKGEEGGFYGFSKDETVTKWDCLYPDGRILKRI
jgi:hypothetical protein